MALKSVLMNPTVLVVALGYLVDIFDITLFSMLRTQSLESLGVPPEELVSKGIFLLNAQMLGMLIGGVLWGVLGDKKGRLTVLFGSILLYSLGNLANAFVGSVEVYAILRLISGIGLAGELGAGITLIAEILPQEKRGLGTTLVAAIGVLGAVLGGILVELLSWRYCYFIGGMLGLMLLFLRFKLGESELFHKKEKNQSVQWGNFLSLFTKADRFKRFILCIFMGIPIWFVAGILMTFSPEISAALGVDGAVLSSRSIAISYLGLAAGDLASGLMGQLLKSRKKSILLFATLTILFIALMFITSPGRSPGYYYFMCFLIGTGAGYWAMFITVAAEHFGTNMRATVATSVPNFVRGAVIPMGMAFKALIPHFEIIKSSLIIGSVVFTLAIVATLILPESFHKEMDYLEH